MLLARKDTEVGRSAEILIEGLLPREIFRLPDADLDALLLRTEPIVFSVGSASILASFRVRGSALVIELGHIDGGGEGVLRTLWLLAEQYATKRELGEIDWLVHAVRCPHPNVKLRRVLEKRGFSVQDVPGTGCVYRLIQRVRRGGR